MAGLQFQLGYQVLRHSLFLWLTCSSDLFAGDSMSQQSRSGVFQQNSTTHVSSHSHCHEGNGKAMTQARPLTDFSAINIDGAFTITIELQQERTLTIKGDENLLSRFVTTVEGQTLFVRTQGAICPKISPEIRLTNDSLISLLADGSTDIQISHLKNTTFTVNAGGSSDLKLSGTSEKFIGTFEGANSLRAREFQTQETTIRIHGTGEAVLNVSKKLVAEVNGVGNIQYVGNPPIVEKHITGAGNIEPQ